VGSAPACLGNKDQSGLNRCEMGGVFFSLKGVDTDIVTISF